MLGHCAKAFMRSRLWQPDTWQPEAVPRRARIAKLTDRPLDSMAELERHDGESYSSTLS